MVFIYCYKSIILIYLTKTIRTITIRFFVSIVQTILKSYMNNYKKTVAKTVF